MDSAGGLRRSADASRVPAVSRNSVRMSGRCPRVIHQRRLRSVQTVFAAGCSGLVCRVWVARSSDVRFACPKSIQKPICARHSTTPGASRGVTRTVVERRSAAYRTRSGLLAAPIAAPMPPPSPAEKGAKNKT